MEFKINKKSWHFKYFIFLKKFGLGLSKIFAYSPDNPIYHYLYWENIKWYHNIDARAEFLKFNFSIHKYPLKLLKLTLKRIILFFLWFNFLMLIPVITESILALIFTINTMALNYIIGPKVVISLFTTMRRLIFVLLTLSWLSLTFPVFFTTFLSDLYKILREIINMLTRNISAKDEIILPKYFISYICYTLFSPIFFLLAVLLEILTKFIISTFAYITFIVIWLIEIIWLTLNFSSLIIIGMVLILLKVLLFISKPIFSLIGKLLSKVLLIKISSTTK